MNPYLLLYFMAFTENSIQRNIYERIVVNCHNATTYAVV